MANSSGEFMATTILALGPFIPVKYTNEPTKRGERERIPEDPPRKKIITKLKYKRSNHTKNKEEEKATKCHQKASWFNHTVKSK